MSKILRLVRMVRLVRISKIYKQISILVQALSANLPLLFFKLTSDLHCTARDNFLHMKADCREHGLGSIIQLLVKSENN